MTKKEALTVALNALLGMDTEEAAEAITSVNGMIAQLSKPANEEKRAAANAARKEKTAAARAELVAAVAPVLRGVLMHTQLGMTAKDIFIDAQPFLPQGFSWQKVQNILLREMREELDVIEAKGKPNLYRLKEAEA